MTPVPPTQGPRGLGRAALDPSEPLYRLRSAGSFTAGLAYKACPVAGLDGCDGPARTASWEGKRSWRRPGAV